MTECTDETVKFARVARHVVKAAFDVDEYSKDCFAAVNLGLQMLGFGRVRPTNPLDSLPVTCRSIWAATQPTFV